MNASQLVDKVATNLGLSKARAKETVDAVIEIISSELVVNGGEVALPGFGKFKVKDRPARTGRNPATGESVEIAASKKVAFSASSTLKARL